jgi:hypothetical protein
MVKPTAQSGTAIEKLLQDRNQYEQWLARLPSAGDAPDAVRQRVRADYEARLRGVMDELRSHGDTVSADLQRFRAAEAELARHEAAAQERIAEAEIRHAVGEFEESKWQEIREEASRGLNEARTELTDVRAEIARLAEVQGLISAPAAARTEAAPAEPQEFEPVIVENPEPPAAPAPAAAAPQAAPRFVPKAPGAAEAAAPPGDELAFLKSVTGSEAASTVKPRPSGGQPAPTEPAAPAAAAPAAAKAASSQQAKTLKCAECGTLNRPTEWYCERCGAELAAL